MASALPSASAQGVPAAAVNEADKENSNSNSNADGGSAISSAKGEDARADTTMPRVIPLSGGPSAGKPPKPSCITGSANVSNAPESDQSKSSSDIVNGHHFYKLSAAEVCDLAFEGLANMKPHFRSTWELANLCGKIIIDDLQLHSLSEALVEIETMANVKIAFIFSTPQNS